MSRKVKVWIVVAGLLGLASGIGIRTWGLVERTQIRAQTTSQQVSLEAEKSVNQVDDHEAQLVNTAWLTPFKDQVPISFVNRAQNTAEWDKLPAFWNETTEEIPDPTTGKTIKRKAVKIKVPLGLTANPPVPAENPMNVDKWKLGKALYFDRVLSSDRTVACATCHDPGKGYTDQSRFSTGISGKLGGMSAPTVFNSGYIVFQFWDGRASSLEDQAQGPVQNAVEMFGGDGHAWRSAIKRLRDNPKYVEQFKKGFGTLPTRDAAAKAIATYERTVLSGNSLFDRAEVVMRKRVEDEESTKFVQSAKDYATVLKAAFAGKDANALKSLTLDPDRDQGKVDDVAKSLANGRDLFFGKARCSLCHAGDNFTDQTFHNLGVGVKDGKLPTSLAGRYRALPTGHKNPEFFGAFKTPTLRHLLGTGPYMHDGSEKSLEEVVEFYDRGGNANEFLDVKMRDEDAERAWWMAKEAGKPYQGAVEVKVFNGKPIAPKKLNLTAQEKKDVVMFLRALQGDQPDPLVSDPKKYPE